MSQKLIYYLAELNCSDNTQFVYADPDNLDNFCIGREAPSGFVGIGDLSNLSFGFQSRLEALTQWLDNADGSFVFKGRTVRYDRDGLINAYFEGLLGDAMFDFLTNWIDSIVSEWSLVEAEFFVSEKLPDILAQHQADTDWNRS
jgi:hypothetical protein